MQDRQARIQEQVVKKRDLVVTVMDRTYLTNISKPDFTNSLPATARPLVISGKNSIPSAYWNEQVLKLDKKKLIASLSARQTVPGASLGNSGVTVSVRVK